MDTADQNKQNVAGDQLNVAGDATVGQVGDNIDTGGGDYVARDKIINLPQDLVRRLLASDEREDFTVAELTTEYWEPETVFIPEGPFLMGSPPGEGISDFESPQFELTLPGYRIGKYPVTNEQYARFVWRTGRIASKFLLWNGNEPKEDMLDLPVSGVTWYEALDYCQWLSESTSRLYTLPTEAQWEKAARSTGGRTFPWGNDWDPKRCNAEKDKIMPVTAYPAQSEYGCYDIVGNRREWTMTAWGKEPRQPDKKYAYPRQDDRRNGVEEPSTTRRIFRSGWASEPNGFRCTARGGYLPEKPGPRYNRHGFRVLLLPII